MKIEGHRGVGRGGDLGLFVVESCVADRVLEYEIGGDLRAANGSTFGIDDRDFDATPAIDDVDVPSRGAPTPGGIVATRTLIR